jgi:hypothetical protein
MAARTAPRLEGVGAVLREITAMAAKAQDPTVRLVVGYDQEYAVYVHERLDLFHPVGQAKFLEQPARQYAAAMGRRVSQAMKAGKPLKQALLEAGLLLQAESQKLVPVDTGALRASAFTRVEEVS